MSTTSCFQLCSRLGLATEPRDWSRDARPPIHKKWNGSAAPVKASAPTAASLRPASAATIVAHGSATTCAKRRTTCGIHASAPTLKNRSCAASNTQPRFRSVRTADTRLRLPRADHWGALLMCTSRRALLYAQLNFAQRQPRPPHEPSRRHRQRPPAHRSKLCLRGLLALRRSTPPP